MRMLVMLSCVLCCSALVKAEDSRWAILIGPGRFADSALRPLPNAANDVRLIAESLLAAGYEPDHVIVLTDDTDNTDLHPTRTVVRNQIRRVIEQISATPASTLMVVFAGHGVNIKGASFLCPTNSQLSSPDKLLSLAEISEAIAACSAAQKFLIVDACRNEINAPGETDFNLLTGLQKLNLSSEGSQGLVYFASCLARQKSVEDPETNHGVFLQYFAEALTGKADVLHAGNRDGEVSSHEVFQYASELTKLRSQKLTGWQQQPWYEGRQTSGLSLVSLKKERRDELASLAGDQEPVSSAASLHSMSALTEALYALQEGDMNVVLARSLEAIELDGGNRMAFRTAAMAYQFENQLEKAFELLNQIQEPLRIRIGKQPVSVRAELTEVGLAEPGEQLEVDKLQNHGGKQWLRVIGIRNPGTGQSRKVDGFVDFENVKGEATSREQIVQSFSDDNQQPVQMSRNWQSTGSQLSIAYQKYEKIRSIIDEARGGGVPIPVAPPIPIPVPPRIPIPIPRGFGIPFP